MREIHVGSVVVATRDGGYDDDGLPLARPIAGRTYRVESIYVMHYGLGCTLQGMDPRPYRGYLLFVNERSYPLAPGWYFKPIEVADPEWTRTFLEYVQSKTHEPVRHK